MATALCLCLAFCICAVSAMQQEKADFLWNRFGAHRRLHCAIHTVTVSEKIQNLCFARTCKLRYMDRLFTILLIFSLFMLLCLLRKCVAAVHPCLFGSKAHVGQCRRCSCAAPTMLNICLRGGAQGVQQEKLRAATVGSHAGLQLSDMEGSIGGRRFVGLSTVGDGSCALHAAFGEADMARRGQFFCRDARSMVSQLLPDNV